MTKILSKAQGRGRHPPPGNKSNQQLTFVIQTRKVWRGRNRGQTKTLTETSALDTSTTTPKKILKQTGGGTSPKKVSQKFHKKKKKKKKKMAEYN